MRHPASLPTELVDRTFTRAEAVRLGVTDHRLRASDLQRVGYGIYQHLSGERSSTPVAKSESGLSDDELGLLRALCMRSPDVRVSHVTAARAYGLALPRKLQAPGLIHLSTRSATYRGVSDPRVRIHRCKDAGPQGWTIRRVPLSAPAELFVEMAQCLRLSELVIIGDQLVREPRPGLESRASAWATTQELTAAVARGKGRHRIGRARQALEMIRVGADSPAETYMRLAIVQAGLPEPELQVRLHPQDRYSPVGDAGYRQVKIVLQYDGAHHYSAAQQARDQRRNAAFEAEGWTVILVNRVDHQEGFRRMVARLRHLLGT